MFNLNCAEIVCTVSNSIYKPSLGPNFILLINYQLLFIQIAVIVLLFFFCCNQFYDGFVCFSFLVGQMNWKYAQSIKLFTLKLVKILFKRNGFSWCTSVVITIKCFYFRPFYFFSVACIEMNYFITSSSCSIPQAVRIETFQKYIEKYKNYILRSHFCSKHLYSRWDWHIINDLQWTVG